jgi:hypothetical protein
MRRMKTEETGDTPKLMPVEITDAFHEFGWDLPGLPWKEVVTRLGPAYELTGKDGKPNNRKASLLLARCKLAYARGERAARKNQPGITAKAREYARKHA